MHLYKSLSETSGFVTYLSPIIGNPKWTSSDPQLDPRIKAVMDPLRALLTVPVDLGLGLTILQTGVFLDTFFDLKWVSCWFCQEWALTFFADEPSRYLGTDLDGNKVRLYKDAATKPLALV